MISDFQEKIFIKEIKNLGFTCIPEYKFCETRKFKSDFCILEKKILIEKEGGVFTGQAHGSVTGILRDMEKYNLATSLGFKILRVLPNKLNSTEFLNLIKKLLNYEKD